MAKHTPGRLYFHKTDGGAEYLCAGHVEGCDEGDLRTAVVRLDGPPELFPLYAAAPNLLAACKKFCDYYSGAKVSMLGNGQASKSLYEFRAAIAKAGSGGTEAGPG